MCQKYMKKDSRVCSRLGGGFEEFRMTSTSVLQKTPELQRLQRSRWGLGTLPSPCRVCKDLRQPVLQFREDFSWRHKGVMRRWEDLAQFPWTKISRAVLSFPANRNTAVDRAAREPGQPGTVQSPRRPEERYH